MRAYCKLGRRSGEEEVMENCACGEGNVWWRDRARSIVDDWSGCTEDSVI